MGRHVLFVIWRPHRFTQVPSSRVSDVPTGTCLQASPLPPQTHSDCSLLIPQPPRVPAGLPQPSDRVLEAWDDQTRPRPLPGQVQTVRAAAQPPPPTLFSNSDYIPMTPSPPPDHRDASHACVCCVFRLSILRSLGHQDGRGGRVTGRHMGLD